MKVRRGLFRIWIVLTALYVIWGIIDGAEGIYWKFHVSAQGRWLHLAIAVAMAVGVPLLVLGIGWAFLDCRRLPPGTARVILARGRLMRPPGRRKGWFMR
jgi:hypothetical protein